jgi:hypothetical protein
MVKTWQALCETLPNFTFKRTEPDLTKILAKFCDDTRDDSGLLGRYRAEVMGVDIDANTGKVHNERRSDIEYDCQRTPLTLVFEFKKLRINSDGKAYYGQRGILKFVDGRYSPAGEFGCMVGVIATGNVERIQSLRRALAATDVVNLISLKRQANAQPLIDPSSSLPGVADFDTQHARNGQSETLTIHLAHLFLQVQAPE